MSTWLDVHELNTDGLAGGWRSPALDRVRGLAIVLMAVDHVASLSGWVVVEDTVGRAAMPLFFVLAGSLLGRLRWRHAQLVGLGLLLPVVMPWLDAPNVLTLYGVGALVIWLWRRLVWPVWVLAAAGLTQAANGWAGGLFFTGYQPLALLGLLALGAMLPRTTWSWGSSLPGWMGLLGRFPVTVYVGHLLVLTAIWGAW